MSHCHLNSSEELFTLSAKAGDDPILASLTQLFSSILSEQHFWTPASSSGGGFGTLHSNVSFSTIRSKPLEVCWGGGAALAADLKLPRLASVWVVKQKGKHSSIRTYLFVFRHHWLAEGFVSYRDLFSEGFSFFLAVRRYKRLLRWSLQIAPAEVKQENKIM